MAKKLKLGKPIPTKLSDLENDLYYCNRELKLSLTKDDFVWNEDFGAYIYTGSPKLEWLTGGDVLGYSLSVSYMDGEVEQSGMATEVDIPVIQAESVYVILDDFAEIYNGTDCMTGDSSDSFAVCIYEDLSSYLTYNLELHYLNKKTIPQECVGGIADIKLRTDDLEWRCDDLANVVDGVSEQANIAIQRAKLKQAYTIPTGTYSSLVIELPENYRLSTHIVICLPFSMDVNSKDAYMYASLNDKSYGLAIAKYTNASSAAYNFGGRSLSMGDLAPVVEIKCGPGGMCFWERHRYVINADDTDAYSIVPCVRSYGVTGITTIKLTCSTGSFTVTQTGYVYAY